MYDYLEDFYGQVVDVKAGRKSAERVTGHTMTGPTSRWARLAWHKETFVIF